jgi:hypothetical protein
MWTRTRLLAVGASVLVLALIAVGSQFIHSGASAPPVATPDLTASQVLQRAALVAFRTPPTTARPDQFVYIESLAQGYWELPDGNHGLVLTPMPQVRQFLWASADGRHEGLLRQDPLPGSVPCPLPGVCGKADNVTIERGCPVVRPAGYNCTPNPAYRADLPTTTEAMKAFLYAQPPTPENAAQADAGAFQTVENMAEGTLIPPAALSALFSAAAEIPGVTVDQNMVDAAGRHGIAVGRTYQGFRQELIFDRQTFNYLGTREVTAQAIYGVAAGTVTGFTAVLKAAVVDRVGQQP